jgi:hypothetical protein
MGELPNRENSAGKQGSSDAAMHHNLRNDHATPFIGIIRL